LDAARSTLGHLPRFRLTQGYVSFRLGDLDAAQALLHPLVERDDELTHIACTFLADVLHHAGNTDAVRSLLSQNSAWKTSPEGRFFDARLEAAKDPEAAAKTMQQLARQNVASPLRRMAGFEATRLLEQLGRFREAFALAETIQRSTAKGFDLNQLLQGFENQISLLQAGKMGPYSSLDAKEGICFILGLPRSGTTLLEQMLDRHHQICGIGEYQGSSRLTRQLVQYRAWPDQLDSLGSKASQLRNQYTETAQCLARKHNASWITDKSLNCWQWIPALAAILPGSAYLHLQRDPRDTAISIYLSAIRPSGSMGWVSNLTSIQEVIKAHHRLVPVAIEALKLNAVTIDYESLVQHTEDTLQACMQCMHLTGDPKTMNPELNPRIPITLSHTQVKKAVHSESINRWQNYAWAFGI
jgi:hypothetical protein